MLLAISFICYIFTVGMLMSLAAGPRLVKSGMVKNIFGQNIHPILEFSITWAILLTIFFWGPFWLVITFLRFIFNKERLTKACTNNLNTMKNKL